ncbi:leucine-rich repeat domain-containing protein [Skeletonema marinoi]|uniref:Leucine-rich repeat domain-containing protein n=1 Tax=Skeletonema marinoi TaxID=267567 RepID=A0AAD8Y2U1_9STRA|nr:leucine-rich repeat domain-containing protein [Skeletonema marinoi]
MADHADNDNDGEIFLYRGGRAPLHVSHARIDESVDVIEDEAFRDCRILVHVETHDGIRKVGQWAFQRCKSLMWINLKSAVEIGEHAFDDCENLEVAEFGDKLETIERYAFKGCSSLQRLNLPSIIITGRGSFRCCKALTDIDLSERLETIREGAFVGCHRLRRIAIPLKRGLFSFNVNLQKYNQFDRCDQLTTVDLVGEAHTKVISSLHMKCWRAEMEEEINRINQVLPTTPGNEKTAAIKQWVDSVMDKMDRYKAEHCRFVKEATTLLELALWKARLGEIECSLEPEAKKAKVDAESARRERRITCGADIVIKNVLPFLQLK